MLTITKQEALNVALAGIRKQKIQSRLSQEIVDNLGVDNQKHLSLPLSEETCAYRGACGAKCLIGFVIPDEAYTPSMEGMEASSLDLFPEEDERFYGEFQIIHDAMKIGQEWSDEQEQKAKELALKYNLIFPEIED